MRWIEAGEQSAAKRRVYFHLVGTDGITPATSEAGGQPMASFDGAAWGTTGIGTVFAIGTGRYYAELTSDAVGTAGVRIETRYGDASTAECPGDSVDVVRLPYTSQATWSELGTANLLTYAPTAITTKLPTGAAGANDGLPTVTDVAKVTRGGRVWFVDGATGDDSDDGTPGSPKDTISGAISAASSGDTIIVAAGTYSGQLNFDSKRLTIIGISGVTVTSNSSGATITGVVSGSMLKGLTVTNTDTATGQGALIVSGASGITIEDCDISGPADAIAPTETKGLVARRCIFTSKWDGILFTGDTDFLFEDCTVTSDGTYAGGSFDGRAVVLSSNPSGTFRRCRISASRNDTASNYCAAVAGEGRVTFEQCNLSAAQASTGAGAVSALREITATAAKRIILDHCTLSSSSGGAGTVMDIVNSQGVVLDTGSSYSRAKVSGNQPVAIKLDALETGVYSGTVPTITLSGTVTTVVNPVVAGTVTGTVVVVSGTVNTVTNPIGTVHTVGTATTVADKTGYSLAADQSTVTLGTVHFVGTVLSGTTTATLSGTVEADVTRIKGVALGGSVGTNFAVFFQNGGTATTKVLEDVGVDVEGGGDASAANQTTIIQMLQAKR